MWRFEANKIKKLEMGSKKSEHGERRRNQSE